MASRETVLGALTVLEAAYNVRIDQIRKEIYIDRLADIEDPLLTAAVKHCINTIKFIPSIAEIRSAVVTISKYTYSVPTANEAWQELVNAPAPRLYQNQCEYAANLRDKLIEAQRKPEVYNGLMNELIYHDRSCEVCQSRTRVLPTFSHPMIQQVAERLGWPDKFWSGEIGVDRGRFIKTYENELAILSEQAGMTPDVRGYIESSRADLDQVKRQFRDEAFDRGERLLQNVTRSLEVK